MDRSRAWFNGGRQGLWADGDLLWAESSGDPLYPSGLPLQCPLSDNGIQEAFQLVFNKPALCHHGPLLCLQSIQLANSWSALLRPPAFPGNNVSNSDNGRLLVWINPFCSLLKLCDVNAFWHVCQCPSVTRRTRGCACGTYQRQPDLSHALLSPRLPVPAVEASLETNWAQMPSYIASIEGA